MKKFRITVNGRTYEVEAEPITEASSAPVATVAHSANLTHHPFSPAAAKDAPSSSREAPGDVISPLAGKVVSIDVAEGASVTEGQKLLTLEAMKMNTLVNAVQAGTVKAILVSPGQAVAEGELLVRIS
jgi:biotin carboxyl carrier protein